MTYRERGFTLIELLVVIAIIGVLASIVMASLITARQKARDARRVSDIEQIRLGLELFWDANSNVYPTNGQTLTVLQPTYLPTVPKDPTTTNIYPYYNCASNNSYHIGAGLESTNSSVLQNDADIDYQSATFCSGNDNVVDGLSTKANCAQENGITSANDTCFDLTN
ncbi:MAG: prepilin-type N-terminal cleavage/methylation domain-containing protein [Candidatus Sungbacteria bacterium]|uniref:Prepilin-type N-terminal cleavage/methylation domain-containing protein n=1 Tax=Candidatus Sungiibacteriota bacterium TaxID=2750080 RepID=A0A9D6LTJ4_9BACT|nr:prepilin-type N-terminal cleavage/methylation domain-containing protein [Candidatus Sungbacteria bacterium]